ncbi:MAG: hypothetical protein ACFFAN_10450 [Promethearchaeota archaeon]
MASIAYCPNCKRNVATKRKNFKFLLAFILAFTGIGLIIYILYYVDQKSNRCVHCETICQPFQIVDQSNQNQELEQFIPGKIENEKIKFCSDCGAELKQRETIKYCSLCGNNIE